MRQDKKEKQGADVQALIEALRELVACKDLDSEMARLTRDSPTWQKTRDEYERRKPLAWTAARAALESAPAVQPAEPPPELLELVKAARELCEYGPNEHMRERLRRAGRAFYATQPAEWQRLFNGLQPAAPPPAAVPARFRWDRELAPAEVAAVSANPWQMFDPAVPAQPAESAGPVALLTVEGDDWYFRRANYEDIPDGEYELCAAPLNVTGPGTSQATPQQDDKP